MLDFDCCLPRWLQMMLDTSALRLARNDGCRARGVEAHARRAERYGAAVSGGAGGCDAAMPVAEVSERYGVSQSSEPTLRSHRLMIAFSKIVLTEGIPASLVPPDQAVEGPPSSGGTAEPTLGLVRSASPLSPTVSSARGGRQPRSSNSFRRIAQATTEVFMHLFPEDLKRPPGSPRPHPRGGTVERRTNCYVGRLPYPVEAAPMPAETSSPRVRTESSVTDIVSLSSRNSRGRARRLSRAPRKEQG